MVTKEMAKNLPTVRECDEMNVLKDYVIANDDYRYDGMAEGSLRMDVTHSNLVQRWHDLPFFEEMSVMQVKEKLYRHGGTPCVFQELYLRRGGGDTVFLMDEEKSLRYYGARSGMEIHIKDLDPHSLSKNGGLEDVSQVEKYVMPDEEYDKIQNSVRAVKKQREAQKQKAEAEARANGEGPEEEEKAPDPWQQMSKDELNAAFPVGGRCEIEPGARRGEIKYTGAVTGMKGQWIGVCLDEPQGNNDGTKDGFKFFDCPGPKYGCFLKPENVKVGDYPELDPFASDDEF